jgi:hypothetical protein
MFAITGLPTTGLSDIWWRRFLSSVRFGSVRARALEAELVAFGIGEDQPPRAGWLVLKDGRAESD